MTKVNSIFGQFLSPLSPLYGRVLLLVILFAPLANAQPDDSLEYFVTHAHALVRDVRETLVIQGTPQARRMAQFEEKMEAVIRVVSSLKESEIQAYPEGGQKGQYLILSSLRQSPTVSVGRDCIVRVIQGVDKKIWGLNVLFKKDPLSDLPNSYSMAIERNLAFQNPVDLPLESQSMLEEENTQFLNQLLKIHCSGLTEDQARCLLPEGMPFDASIAQSITYLAYIAGELSPFMERGINTTHPYVELLDLVFPHVIPEYRDEKSRGHYKNTDNPTDWCTYTHQACVRWIQDGEGGTHQMNFGWSDFYKWCQERLNRSLDSPEYDVKMVEWRERLKNLMRRGPFTRLFNNSPEESGNMTDEEFNRLRVEE